MSDGTERKYENPQTGEPVFLPRFEPVTLHLRMEVLSTGTRLFNIALQPYMMHVINRIILTASPRNRPKNEFGMTSPCSILRSVQILS